MNPQNTGEVYMGSTESSNELLKKKRAEREVETWFGEVRDDSYGFRYGFQPWVSLQPILSCKHLSHSVFSFYLFLSTLLSPVSFSLSVDKREERDRVSVCLCVFLPKNNNIYNSSIYYIFVGRSTTEEDPADRTYYLYLYPRPLLFLLLFFLSFFSFFDGFYLLQTL